MKVIEYGRIKPIRARCPYCEALLEFNVRGSMYCKGKLFVDCIVCGAMIYEDEWKRQEDESTLFNTSDIKEMFQLWTFIIISLMN